MNLDEFSDFNIDQLLGPTGPLQDGLVAPYKQVPLPRINQDVRAKRSRLAERIAQNDELIRQVKQLQAQNKQLADLQRTAQEVTDLYQKEKQQRSELEKRAKQIGERCGQLEKELDAQVGNCENLQEQLQMRGLPVDAKDVLSILMQLAQRLGDDCGLLRRDQNIMKKLKEHCKTIDVSVPTPKSPNPRNKRKGHQPGVNQSTQTDEEAAKVKPVLCSVAVQVEGLIETRNQGTQHKNTTTTRGTTTASFIKHQDVGTCFPEPKPLPNIRQILDEMLSWRADIVIEPMSPLSDLQQELELEDIPVKASVATCTTLCDIHREIDFIADLPTQIKVSASRPPSRTMLDSMKEEARSSRELAKELLNFLPQNQSCLTNMPPQAFEELWQVFGQMVLALLQRRSNASVDMPPSVSQADFANWLYELYEGTQKQTEQTSSGSTKKRDFATSTECMDAGTDPIIESPNISHGGHVTPIRLPSKPKERKRKSKKRKASTIPKSIAKRSCLEMETVHLETSKTLEVEREQMPETAIQFLSNLETFNMANCDNLEMELDEEELFLLQLTSNAEKKDNEETCRAQATEDLESPAQNSKFLLSENKNQNHLPAVQKETDSSLKEYDEEPDKIEEIEELLHKRTFEIKENTGSLTKVAPNKDISSYPFSLAEDRIDSSSEPNEIEVNASEDSESHLDKGVSNSERDSINNLDGTVMELIPFKEPKSFFSKKNGEMLPTSIMGLFGSDSDMESESSVEQMASELSDSEEFDDNEEECISADEPSNTKNRKNNSLFGSESESEENEERGMEAAITEAEEKLGEKESEQKSSAAVPPESYEEPLLAKADLLTIKQPLIVDNPDPIVKSLNNAQHTSSCATPNSTDESEDEQGLVIDEQISTRQPEEPPSPVPVAAKRRRTQSEMKTSSPSAEVRLTRQRAKQLLVEQKTGPEKGISLVEQIRNQLKQAITRSEPLRTDSTPNLKPLEHEELKPTQPDVNLEPLKLSCTFSEESPASPASESMDELDHQPIEIPLEQATCTREDDQPMSIVQHVLKMDKGLDQLKKANRKTLGKSQPQLCASIGKYLQESMQLESSCSDLALEIYKVTKSEAVIVNALITVICKIGVDDGPVERLLNALKYLNFSQRFLAELEERLFRNPKERPATELALNYVRLYLKAAALQATMSAGCAHPVRLLLAKILYKFDRDMPPLVLEVLRHFPTVLPHREQREYDNSDALITVIKHLLMSRQYDMVDPNGAERLLLSKLRFEYHFQPFEPTKQQVLENLVGKLKAGREEELGYAFALFCRQSPHLKVVESVVAEHLMPLATSYCDLAAQNKSYDARLVLLLHCISLVLKPLPLDTDISAFVGFLKRLLVAVPRSEVQLAAVQASLRLQRFGFKYTLDALKDYRPNYELDPLTRAMLRCFAERRRHFRHVAATGKASRD
ncbi:little elongation complex subunit 1 [Drosophila teissieri]|uniref:little elongation complex subunit 1 n=1 Tax=Drosophila teissieri TaxID=7243 RepID=UPI001CBA1801|nr:little elongation complex subunit 1 [Drosophila teissieri]